MCNNTDSFKLHFCRFYVFNIHLYFMFARHRWPGHGTESCEDHLCAMLSSSYRQLVLSTYMQLQHSLSYTKLLLPTEM